MNPILTHSLVAAEGAAPTRWLLCLHGILGSGSNWRSFARRLVTDFPAWGAVVADLRMHGGSQGFPAPHSLQAAAADLEALEEKLPGPVRGVLGHSFGGKVALAYVASRASELSNAFILDSMPGARVDQRGSESSVEVLAALEAMGPQHASREHFVAQVEQRGFSRGLAQWLAMNLERNPEGYQLRLELPAIRALLEDYFRQDFWPVVERSPSSLRVDFILGGKSGVFDRPAREQLEQLCRSKPNVHVTVLPQAGHWVHVDDPEGLYAAVRQGLQAA